MLINVVPYKPEWPQQFELEASMIQTALGEVLVNIFHIGSTSVPGLRAKPIIDIMLEIADHEGLDSRSLHMEKLGYEVMGEYGIAGRRYFRKGGNKRTHHVHAFKTGDPNLLRHLAFRDYLRAHQEVAEAYGALKAELVERSNQDMGSYGDGKEPFIQLHERKALDWYAGK